MSCATADGDPGKGIPPVEFGLHFHDLRHAHITWMDEVGTQEILMHTRVGHRMSGVKGRYRHPTPAMVETLMHRLQSNWETSLAETGATSLFNLAPFSPPLPAACCPRRRGTRTGPGCREVDRVTAPHAAYAGQDIRPSRTAILKDKP